MALYRIKHLWTAVKVRTSNSPPRYEFQGPRKDLDAVSYQDEYTGIIGSLRVGEFIKYGYRLLAGEPPTGPQNAEYLTIIWLQIESSRDGTNWKDTLTFRYKERNRPTTIPFRGKGGPRTQGDEEPPVDPEPNSDPTTYPDPDSDLPTYDDNNPPDGDDNDDPPTGDGSDCDGTIGICA
jgi:hypothetical protein